MINQTKKKIERWTNQKKKRRNILNARTIKMTCFSIRTSHFDRYNILFDKNNNNTQTFMLSCEISPYIRYVHSQLTKSFSYINKCIFRRINTLSSDGLLTYFSPCFSFVRLPFIQRNAVHRLNLFINTHTNTLTIKSV